MRIFPKIRLRWRTGSTGAVYRASKRLGPQRHHGTVRLLDLTSAVGAARSVENLYESLVCTIGGAFSAPAASLFIRDDLAGDFPCYASTVISADDRSRQLGHLTLSSDSFLIRRLKNLSVPLRLDASDLNAWKEGLSEVPSKVLEQRMQEKNVILQTHSSLFVQLRAKGNMLGVLSLGERPTGRFSLEDLEVLNGLATELALVIENTKLLQRLVEHERWRAELAVAAEVQRKLLPEAGLVLPGIEICGFCQPASQVGGDYYDFVALAGCGKTPFGALVQ